MQARTVLYNALLFSSIDATKIPLPRATYTDPEIATVGATE
jgi:pyruvate/2-oxoglutarate dehydrogenase complex dihydrolipoamide dehydrogenase (E3) component